MHDLNGIPLKALPVHDLEWVKDLENFDGPLLSQFRHRRQGDNYLFYWCDCDKQLNRWMVLRVSETSLIRLVNRMIPLDQVIPKGCQDDFVYFVDMDEDGGHKIIHLLALEAVPQEYTPGQGAFISAEVAERLGWYSIIIERSLTIPKWRELLRDFSNAYSFLYNLVKLKSQRLKGHPWKGNFSAMHFWREITSFVPSEDSPELAAMQYASPGYIRYKLDSQVASRVGDMVSLYLESFTRIEEAYKNLAAFIRANKLNDLQEDDPRWKGHNGELERLTRFLVQVLDLPASSEFLAAARRPFEAAKMTIAFAQRIRQLAGFEADGLVRLPNTKPAAFTPRSEQAPA